MEHERQRLIQRKLFEDQMRVLEQKQAQELLSIPFEPNGASGVQHLAASAPTTPPRNNVQLGTCIQSRMDVSRGLSSSFNQHLSSMPQTSESL